MTSWIQRPMERMGTSRNTMRSSKTTCLELLTSKITFSKSIASCICADFYLRRQELTNSTLYKKHLRILREPKTSTSKLYSNVSLVLFFFILSRHPKKRPWGQKFHCHLFAFCEYWRSWKYLLTLSRWWAWVDSKVLLIHLKTELWFQPSLSHGPQSRPVRAPQREELQDNWVLAQNRKIIPC